ncbi:MAG: M15 family metallopeptidase [Janthinobacterium lividum]
MLMQDAVSEQRLALVHPLLAAKVRVAVADLAVHGTYFRVAQGLRTYAQQDSLYEQGRSLQGHIVTNARAGFSNHNFGCAVDCYPFLTGPTGDLNWDASTPQFKAMVAALKAQGLVWGGDWHTIIDNPHFQLASVPVTPTNQDRAAYLAGGLKAVWALYPSV